MKLRHMLILFIVYFSFGYVAGLYRSASLLEHGPLLDNVKALERAAHELRNPFTSYKPR